MDNESRIGWAAAAAIAWLPMLSGCEHAVPSDEARPQAAMAVDTVAAPQPILTLQEIASAARGFPAMWTADGALLAEGTYTRWTEGEVVHVRLGYELVDGRVVEEEASFAPGPPLEQRTWRWTESSGEQRLRSFAVDFVAGTAGSERLEDGATERDDGEIDATPGTTFAGFGFTVALQALRERLVEGTTAELQAVVFLFGPRTVGVEVRHGGAEEMRMAGRTLTGDRFDLVPQVPWLVDLVVDAPTSHIWLLRPPPSEFLRFEGPLAEPDDPRVRIDLLPGAESGAARPVTAGTSQAPRTSRE